MPARSKVDRLPFRPGERQQIIRIGLGVSIIVTVNEVTAHIAAIQIDEANRSP
jgi:hypothetical protein